MKYKVKQLKQPVFTWLSPKSFVMHVLGMQYNKQKWNNNYNLCAIKTLYSRMLIMLINMKCFRAFTSQNEMITYFFQQLKKYLTRWCQINSSVSTYGPSFCVHYGYAFCVSQIIKWLYYYSITSSINIINNIHLCRVKLSMK